MIYIIVSDFTWSDYIEYVISKVNQWLGLLRRIKHLLSFTACQLFYSSLVLPVFDYADLVWVTRTMCFYLVCSSFKLSNISCIAKLRE